MNWKKVPGVLKWIGRVEGKHVATILNHDGKWRMWVDGGEGMQEVQADTGWPGKTTKEMKKSARFAVSLLEFKIREARRLSNPLPEPPEATD